MVCWVGWEREVVVVGGILELILEISQEWWLTFVFIFLTATFQTLAIKFTYNILVVSVYKTWYMFVSLLSMLMRG